MKVYSQKQARWMGAQVGGAIRNAKGLSDPKLRDVLRGKKVKSLPARSRKSK
jgi:hypothetical protein